MFIAPSNSLIYLKKTTVSLVSGKNMELDLL